MKSKILWTEETWNPFTGCSKISAGCANCYAERQTRRLVKMSPKKYRNGFTPTVHEKAMNVPLLKKKPTVYFVNSMSDTFHEDFTDEQIVSLFKVLNKASQHTFQVLTKRAERLWKMRDKLNFTDNIWIGVTVENAKVQGRIEFLRDIPAKVKFLSCEPLIGPLIELDLTGIGWVVVGGESGPGARYVDEKWVRYIRNRCIENDVPFFFKQWGGVNKKAFGRTLDGKIWDEMPE